MKFRKIIFSLFAILITIWGVSVAYAVEQVDGPVNGFTVNNDDKLIEITANDVGAGNGLVSKGVKFYYKKCYDCGGVSGDFLPVFSIKTAGEDKSSISGSYSNGEEFTGVAAAKSAYAIGCAENLISKFKSSGDDNNTANKKAYFIIQFAILYFNGYYSGGQIKLDTTKAVDKAINDIINLAPKTVYTTPSISVQENFDSLKYDPETEYVSEMFDVDVAGSITNNQYTVQLVEAPSGTALIDSSGNVRSNNTFSSNENFGIKFSAKGIDKEDVNVSLKIVFTADLGYSQPVYKYTNSNNKELLLWYLRSQVHTKTLDYYATVALQSFEYTYDDTPGDSSKPDNTAQELSGDQTPVTGDALIYVVWIVGVGAVGYSIYYFKNKKGEDF